ncbi:MAG: hypothetical protein LBJ45_01420 [Holosporaceae bacterium]|jgi:hypothetical protein|nr:hypothetical protein [Holosporaceae bacterium]
MKKIIATLGALAFAVAPALAETYNSASEENQEDQKNIDKDEFNEGFWSSIHFYGGLGAGVSNHRARNDYTYGSRYADGTATGDLAGTSEKEIEGSTTPIHGSAVLGVGSKIKAFYISLEALLDYGPPAKQSNNMQSAIGGRRMLVDVTHKGFSPSVAFRLGLVLNDNLAYLKIGGKYSKTEEHYVEYGTGADGNPLGHIDATSANKISTITPLIALGFEKTFAKRLSARLEAEYTFGRNKTKDFADQGSTKLTKKETITLRTLVCFHIKGWK